MKEEEFQKVICCVGNKCIPGLAEPTTLWRCKKCRNIFCIYHASHHSIYGECFKVSAIPKEAKYMTTPRETNPMSCVCCKVQLDFEKDEYHVFKKARYCIKCYVASHHMNSPAVCPFISFVKKILDMLPTSIDHADAIALTIAINQRIKPV